MHEIINQHTPPSRRRSAQMRGAAMTETVLVLPLVFTVLGLLLFFGWSFAHLHHATVADRYEVWRRVAHAPGPRAIHQSEGAWSGEQLNQTFFAGRAKLEAMNLDYGFPTGPGDLIRDEARQYSLDASQLADDALRLLPSGLAVAFHARPITPLPLADRMSGTVRHRHLRLDNEWKYANGMRQIDGEWIAASPYVGIENVLRDQFLEELNTQLRPLADSNNPIADSLRLTYQVVPPYRGPTLPPTWAP